MQNADDSCDCTLHTVHGRSSEWICHSCNFKTGETSKRWSEHMGEGKKGSPLPNAPSTCSLSFSIWSKSTQRLHYNVRETPNRRRKNIKYFIRFVGRRTEKDLPMSRSLLQVSTLHELDAVCAQISIHYESMHRMSSIFARCVAEVWGVRKTKTYYYTVHWTMWREMISKQFDRLPRPVTQPFAAHKSRFRHFSQQ